VRDRRLRHPEAGDRPILRREPILAILVALVAASAATAALAGGSVWAAACGAAVVVGVWGLERLVAHLGAGGSFGRGVAVGLAGMAARVALAVGALAAIGIAARAEFLDAALAFIVTYTVYVFARLWRHPAVTTSH